jgi:hypothetical protein
MAPTDTVENTGPAATERTEPVERTANAGRFAHTPAPPPPPTPGSVRFTPTLTGTSGSLDTVDEGGPLPPEALPAAPPATDPRSPSFSNLDVRAHGATPVEWPQPTTGVAGTGTLDPKAPGSLIPSNIKGVKDEIGDAVKHVWVKFRTMAHIPPGQTVYPGSVRMIPESHVHPDVHDVIPETLEDGKKNPEYPGDPNDPHIPGPTTDLSAVSLPPGVKEKFDAQEARLAALEQALADRGSAVPAPAVSSEPSKVE